MLGLLTLDGRDVFIDYGLQVSALSGFPGWHGSANRDLPEIAMPAGGSVVDPTTIRRQSALGTVVGYFQGADAATARAYLDSMRSRFGQGEIKMVCSFAPDRYVLGMWRDWTGAPLVDLLYDGQVAVTFQFLIKDGVAFRSVCDGYGIPGPSIRVPIPCGSAACKPVILLSTGGSATSVVDPIVTIRDYGGNVAQQMVLTGTITQDDCWRIDCQRTTITKYAAGAATNGESLWADGGYPVVRPADASSDDGLPATIETYQTSGACCGQIFYRRRY
jgi:hypothetical protein